MDLQHACFSRTAVAGGSPAALGGNFPCVECEIPPQQLFSPTYPGSEMLLFHLESCHGKWIVLACCLHQLQSLLGTASFQQEKNKHYSRNKIHSYFCLIMHHININRLPKEKTINTCFHFSWSYNQLWEGMVESSGLEL